MTFLKKILLLLLSLLWEPTHLWALDSDEEMTSEQKKTQTVGTKRKRSADDSRNKVRSEEETTLEGSGEPKKKKQRTSQPSSVVPESPARVEVIKPRELPAPPPPAVRPDKPGERTLFDRFEEIVTSPPVPIPLIKQITREDEERVGSRRWVPSFQGADAETYKWHKEMEQIIRHIVKKNATGVCGSPQTNFAVARLVFVSQSGPPEPIEIPYFFVSGKPKDEKRTSAARFSTDLSESRLGAQLERQKHYGLRFITKSYQAGTERIPEDASVPHHEAIKTVIDEELKQSGEVEEQDRFMGRDRLLTHSRLMSSGDMGILAMMYFHSEQSLWKTVKKKIKDFKEREDKRIFFWRKFEPEHHFFLDVCSFYDMCWCCGDTLASCCHTLTLGSKVYVRASGCTAYRDQPFKTGYALRRDQEDFGSYKSGIAFEMPGAMGTSYKPYIAHAVASNLP